MRSAIGSPQAMLGARVPRVALAVAARPRRGPVAQALCAAGAVFSRRTSSLLSAFT